MAQDQISPVDLAQPDLLGADGWRMWSRWLRASSAALYMEMNGHHVTGMTNQIVWGTPHVFAVFLIVAASGALNVASVSSVFNRLAYKPFARLSGVLAVSCCRRPRRAGSRPWPAGPAAGRHDDL